MLQYLKSASFKNKTVLLRVDVNEPLTNGVLGDDFRIQKIIPTIQLLINRGCKVIICGHLGRPNGKFDKEFSLKPVAERTAELLGRKFISTDHAFPDYGINHLIFFSGNLENAATRRQILEIPQKDIIFLENLRFYSGEEKNSAFFAKQLSELADIYVNDAFAVCHRKAASVVAITKYITSFAGIVLEQELKNLSLVLNKPKKPFILLMGGIKISDKAKTLEYLGKTADTILLGGGLANSLFSSFGYEIGVSVVEKGATTIAKRIIRNFKNKLILPLDVVVANKKMDKSSIRVSKIYEVKKNEVILDIGPKTILTFSKAMKSAKTLVWNGPLGHFEKKPFDTGTMSLAKVAGGISQGSCYGVVGGGETVDAIRIAAQADYIDHLSTGGGAMLEFLAGQKLPGIEALK